MPQNAGAKLLIICELAKLLHCFLPPRPIFRVFAAMYRRVCTVHKRMWPGFSALMFTHGCRLRTTE